MIDIISSFYISKYSSHLDILRSQELEQCVLNNVNSSFVNKIHLFVDDNDALIRLKEITSYSDKIVVISVGIKPKYSDFFNYILNNLNDNICMITNSDIYLLDVDERLIENLNSDKIMYALTRHEYNMTCPLINNYYGSHDCYIFNSKFITKDIINSHTDFYQNVLGIESHIVKNFCDFNFRVFNPCRQIKIVHLHKTELRNYGNNWVGLHKCGDLPFQKSSCWWIPPITL
jgi:hypothetical protein